MCNTFHTRAPTYIKLVFKLQILVAVVKNIKCKGNSMTFSCLAVQSREKQPNQSYEIQLYSIYASNEMHRTAWTNDKDIQY